MAQLFAAMQKDHFQTSSRHLPRKPPPAPEASVRTRAASTATARRSALHLLALAAAATACRRSGPLPVGGLPSSTLA
eukprot:5797609-Alexandrium_andersonii.AAC.1